MRDWVVDEGHTLSLNRGADRVSLMAWWDLCIGAVANYCVKARRLDRACIGRVDLGAGRIGGGDWAYIHGLGLTRRPARVQTLGKGRGGNYARDHRSDKNDTAKAAPEHSCHSQAEAQPDQRPAHPE